jgi:hypothetical protein
MVSGNLEGENRSYKFIYMHAGSEYASNALSHNRFSFYTHGRFTLLFPESFLEVQFVRNSPWLYIVEVVADKALP